MLSSDEKRANTQPTYTTETRYPTKQIPYNNHQHITISPDGTQIALLNTSMYQLKLCKYDNLSNLRTIIYDKFKHIADNSRTKLSWSLSVSNEIKLPDGTVDVLIAVSCFDMESMKVNNDVNSSSNKSSQVQDSKHNKNNHLNTSTWIISSTRQARIPTSIDNTGGIIKFLDNKGDNSTTNLVVINAKGMTKFTIEHEKLLNDYFSRFFNKMHKLLKFVKEL